MAEMMTLNVRVSGALKDFVARNVGEDGAYDNVSEYAVSYTHLTLPTIYSV